MPNSTGPRTFINVDLTPEFTSGASSFAGTPCGPDCPLCHPELHRTEPNQVLTTTGATLTAEMIENAARRAAEQGGRAYMDDWIIPTFTRTTTDAVMYPTTPVDRNVEWMSNLVKNFRNEDDSK